MIELLLQAERAMSVGLVDRAETLYAQVAEADPKNSIAVVGLARVALERGDEAGALSLARRALAIDPENAAASRMVERLEEVLRYRGEDPGTTAEPEPGPVTAESTVATPEALTPEPTPTAAPPRAAEPHRAAEPRAPASRKRRSLFDRLFRRGRP